MATIVKTGVLLDINAVGHVLRDLRLTSAKLYGDLHVVGKSAIVYYPTNQGLLSALEHKPMHGEISLELWEYFHRVGERFSILVVPASSISLIMDMLHEYDRQKWMLAGGKTLVNKI